MKIETKYPIGKNLFFLIDGKIKEQPIHSIKIDADDSKTDITYWFKIPDSSAYAGWNFKVKNENEVFESRQDLIDSL